MSKVFTITEGLENLGALRTGGQGSVYKGRRTGAFYTAIKILPTPIHNESEDDKNFINFKNEVAKLEKVNEEPNPHVVKILSWGLTDSGSFPFIEMEYIEGLDLCELLHPPHEKIFTLKELIKVADQLAAALAHCHRIGVKHGDIKSNNVKYNIHTGNYMLLDFGLAILTDEQRRSSVRHAGAIEFMAPEQHEGHMLPQTDVYSFGIVLYELFTGQVPFPLNNSGETGRNTVMLAHLEEDIPNALAKRRQNLPKRWAPQQHTQEMQVPDWLMQVINKCLEKDPANRYASGIELQEAIVNGSLSLAENVLSGGTALQAGNAELQAELEKYKQATEEQQKQLVALKALAADTGIAYNETKGAYERSKAMVHLPKPTFMALVGVAALFVILFVFSSVGDNEPDYSSSANMSVADAKSYKSPYVYFKPYWYTNDSLIRARALALAKELKQDEDKWKDEGNWKDEKDEKQADKKDKKKRRKFLGIF
jgi:serine/threonine protein kinase